MGVCHRRHGVVVPRFSGRDRRVTVRREQASKRHEGAAKCIPGAIVPEEQRDPLGTEGCDEEQGELCVPNLFAQDPYWSPPECDPGSSDSSLLAFSAEGRCMPECIPEVADPESPIGEISFNASSWDEGFLCVPCSVDFFGVFPVRDTGVCDL